MRISYKKLWVLLAEKELKKATFRRTLGLSAGTMTKLNKGEVVSLPVLIKICEYFDCNIGNICDVVKEVEASN